MKRIFSALALSLVMSTAAQAQYENTTISIGQTAPELAFNTPEGKTLKLSELRKGRYVLVDFWASWCGPCRRANPRLVQLYNDYTTKKFKTAKNGFTILSVSLDQNKEAWMKAIEADQLKWPNHVSDLGGWNSKAAALYGIQFIPQAFLVSPTGTIVGKYMLAEQAEEDLKKLTSN
jgi:thiol-disulfide isomerase/thioredoxin